MSFKDGFRRFWVHGKGLLQNDGESYEVISLAQWRMRAENFVSDKNLLICLPTEDVYGLWLTLPENMTREEQATAAFWELEANLQEQGLSAEDFVVRGFAFAKDNGENYWLSAVRRDILQKIKGEVSARTMNFDLLAVPQEISSDEILALYREQKIGLLAKKDAERWNYQRLSALVLATTLLLVAIVSVNDVAQYVGAQKELQLAEQQKQNILPVAEKLERLQAEQKNAEAQQEQVEKLTQKDLPWYSVLVHLGATSQMGVTMQSAEIDEDKVLQVTGTATDYNVLAKYVQSLNGDNFFAGDVQLKEATAKEGEGIAFALSLSLAKV